MYIYLLHGVIAIAIEKQCFLSYFEWCIFNWFMDWIFMSQKMSCNIGAQILMQNSNLSKLISTLYKVIINLKLSLQLSCSMPISYLDTCLCFILIVCNIFICINTICHSDLLHNLWKCIAVLIYTVSDDVQHFKS